MLRACGLVFLEVFLLLASLTIRNCLGTRVADPRSFGRGPDQLVCEVSADGQGVLITLAFHNQVVAAGSAPLDAFLWRAHLGGSGFVRGASFAAP